MTIYRERIYVSQPSPHPVSRVVPPKRPGRPRLGRECRGRDGGVAIVGDQGGAAVINARAAEGAVDGVGGFGEGTVAKAHVVHHRRTARVAQQLPYRIQQSVVRFLVDI